MNADKMISNTRIGYLNYYISKTFPNYCKFITKNGFNKLINVIKENEFIKTCNFDKMKNGEYNEVIDFAAELGIVNAFVQEGDAALESFIPDFNKNNI